MYPGRVLASSDAETVILDAQNSSECVNLDAQIMILDAQNRSIGVQLDLRDFVSNLANVTYIYISLVLMLFGFFQELSSYCSREVKAADVAQGNLANTK